MEIKDTLRFLPYLLQDLWELGSNPVDFIRLLQRNVPVSEKTRILDLACGKGAVAIKLAQSLRVQLTGIDLIPEFIEIAKEKAEALQVGEFCHFQTGDIKEVVASEKGYDCVILGSIGNVLGTPLQTFDKAKLTIKPKGYVLIYDVYLLDTVDRKNVRCKECDYLTYGQWLDVFSQSGLKLIEAVSNENASENEANNELIMKRAHELVRAHPDKKAVFQEFVNTQLKGSYDLNHSVAGVSWLLQVI